MMNFERGSISVFLLLTFINLLSPVAQSADLVNVPLGHEVYSFLDRMVTKGALPIATQASLPISRGQVADSLLKISRKFEAGELSLSRIEQAQLKAFIGEFSQELRKRGVKITPQQEIKFPLSFKDRRYALNFQPQVAQRTVLQQTKKSDRTGIFFLHSIIYGHIEEKFAFINNFKWGSLIGGEGYVPPPDEILYTQVGIKQSSTVRSHVKIGMPLLSLEIGTDDLWWGPGRHGALMVSNNSGLKDILKFEGCMSLFKLSSFVTQLYSKLGKKYMSGHRLEISLSDRLCLALDETVIYADRFELRYLNPFTLYLPSLVATEYGLEGICKLGCSSNNTLLGSDIKFRIAPNLEFYSEFMLDDYNIEPNLRGYRNWDQKFGILLGVYYVDALALQDTDFRFEYAFVNQYAYTHESAINAYTDRENVIGHHIGSDADDLWIELKHWFTDKIQALFAYELLRHGEGNVDKFYQPNYPIEWEFLSGITESTHSLLLNLSYLSIGKHYFSAKYRYAWIKNRNNQLSVDASEQLMVVEAGYIF
jgi:hypothetical protein